VFVSYLASTANDIAKEHKRQTISQDDVFRALEDLEFGELVDPLRDVVKGMNCWVAWLLG
jgi:DNA polymerase epsilon subunit 3